MRLARRPTEVERAEREQALARRESLDELFAQALQHGTVTVCQSYRGRWWASIRIPHETLTVKAEHEGMRDTPHEALRAAIDVAEGRG